MYSYLPVCRAQNIKAGSSFTKELDISCGVPQGSILGPLLFNIDIFDLLFIDMGSDIANYADDATPYECAPHHDKLKENLELTIGIINFKVKANKYNFFWSLCQSSNINIDVSITYFFIKNLFTVVK